MTRRNRIVWLLVVLIAAIGAYAITTDAIVVPDRWRPWSPLRVTDEPNFLTTWKLMRASGDDEKCVQALGTATMSYVPLPDRETGPGCGFRNAVRIDRTSAAIGEPFALSCRAALSLAMWERHVLQPASLRILGSPIARIEHFGSYACRNVYSREGAARSRHATADALDIAGFVLGDGKRIRIARDWRDSTSVDATALADGSDIDQAADFLRTVHRGACRYFDATLGPDYNAAHADHFHLDRGGFRACR